MSSGSVVCSACSSIYYFVLFALCSNSARLEVLLLDDAERVVSCVLLSSGSLLRQTRKGGNSTTDESKLCLCALRLWCEDYVVQHEHLL
jgi:hypothetical protein